MKNIYNNILRAIKNGEKLLVILIDPDKVRISELPRIIEKVNHSMASYIFVGGSTVEANDSDLVITEIKKHTSLSIVLFPGDVTQITPNADALLFLSLISGRNPEYLIGKHIESIHSIKQTKLEIIPTGYILIENGKETSVQKVTNTFPLSRNDLTLIVDTAFAGQLLGMKLIYLEAGSGASKPITADIIKAVKKTISIPLIVGGGIKSKQELKNAFNSGADLVVIGTAFEEDKMFFDKMDKSLWSRS